jgi:hypothetical protein
MDVAFHCFIKPFGGHFSTMVRGLVFGLVLFASAVPGGTASAQAAPATSPAAPSSLLAERARLATALNRVNTEIDALKLSGRGLRDDYRLRGRMADAEELARRLTDLDARIGPAGRAAPRPGSAAWPPALRVDPSDDRGELDAKADILSDQARRLTVEADRLEARVADLRARRQLRRRAGQLEDDPFSPLEQAKGRIGVVSSRGTKGAAERPTLGTTDSSGSGPPPTAGGGTTTIAATPQDPTAGLAAQLRGVLDPSSLAEIRKLDAGASAPTNLAAMERAIAALRDKSTQLEANARQLRDRSSPPHP